MRELIEQLIAAVTRMLTPKSAPATRPAPAPMAWGTKVSAEFRDRLRAIALELNADANHLMAVMAFETARTFNPDIRNFAGSGATGLIQFMPATAIGLGTTVEKLAAMTAEQQLEYVSAYFWPYRSRLNTLSDVYMAVLWPAAIGKPQDYVLWDRASRPTAYRQNIGLDVNKDGVVTKREATARVSALLEEGMQPGNAWRG